MEYSLECHISSRLHKSTRVNACMQFSCCWSRVHYAAPSAFGSIASTVGSGRQGASKHEDGTAKDRDSGGSRSPCQRHFSAVAGEESNLTRRSNSQHALRSPTLQRRSAVRRDRPLGPSLCRRPIEERPRADRCHTG